MKWEDVRAALARHQKLIRWLVALAALGLAVKMLVDNRAELEQLGRFHPWHLVALCAMFVVYLLVYAYRFLLVVRAVGGAAIRYREWLKIFIFGRLANAFVAQLGNVYRAGVLKQRHDVPYRAYLNLYAFFAWIDSLLNLAIALVLVLVLKPELKIGGFNAAAAVGVLLVLLLAGPFLAERVLRALRPGPGLLAKAHGLLHGMFETVSRRARDARLMAVVSLMGLLIFGVGLVLFSVAFLGIGFRPDLVDLALFLALYKLSTLVVITPGNIGVREVAYGLLCESLGIGMARGVLVSAVIRVAHYLIVFAMGFALGGADLLKGRRGEEEG